MFKFQRFFKKNVGKLDYLTNRTVKLKLNRLKCPEILTRADACKPNFQRK